MTTPTIKDYLIKQIYIEKNLVTYRSLSRHFGISVTQAKRELEHHHSKALEDSQVVYAVYILSGEVRVLPVAIATRHATRNHEPPPLTQDTDVSMDVDESFAPTQSVNGVEDGGEENDDFEEDGDYENIPVIKVTIVNQKDLEDAKSKYQRINSVRIYALAPSPIIDAALLCTTNESIRKTDASKGAQYAQKIGRIVVSPVTVHKTAEQKATDKKKGKGRAAPVAGPSRIRAPPPQEPKPAAPAGSENKIAAITSAPEAKEESKQKATTASKSKQTGKLTFQPKPKAEEKKEGKPAPKKAGFFAAKPTAKRVGPVGAPVKDEPMEEDAPAEEPKRGVKRKSVAPEASDSESISQATTPPVSRPPSRLTDAEPKESKKAVVTEATSKARKNRVLLDSDDEDEEVALKSKAASKRKQKAAEKARLAEEREAKELMDLDDDAVEHVARKRKAPSPKGKRSGLDMSDDESGREEFQPLSDIESDVPPTKAKKRPSKATASKAKVTDVDEDIEMQVDDVEQEDEDIPKPQRKKREKKVVPVGRNGLKKRKVQKTRVVKDAKGYMQTEDYTDWESVDEGDAGAEEAKPAPKTKAKAKAAVKSASKSKASKSDEGDADGEASSAQPSRAPSRAESPMAEETKAPALKKKAAPAKKPAVPSANVKGKQQSIAMFFGGKPKK